MPPAKNVRVGMEYEPGLIVERAEELRGFDPGSRCGKFRSKP